MIVRPAVMDGLKNKKQQLPMGIAHAYLNFKTGAAPTFQLVDDLLYVQNYSNPTCDSRGC